MKIEKITAIANLVPNGNFEIIGDTIISHRGKIVPSEAEIQTEIDRLQTEYDALAWKRSRQAEYPSTGDQLDYMFHNGFDKWKEDIVQPVKDKYPKPE